jgi:hypothetical protein
MNQAQTKSDAIPAIDGMSDQDLLRIASEFDMGAVGLWWNDGAFRSHVKIQRCTGHRLPMPVMWKVADDVGYVLTRDGWEKEPQPSSRDAEFYARARFGSLVEAHSELLRFYQGTPQPPKQFTEQLTPEYRGAE